jgi:hypothetical protein
MLFGMLTCIIFIAYLDGVVILAGVPPITMSLKRKAAHAPIIFYTDVCE